MKKWMCAAVLLVMTGSALAEEKPADFAVCVPEAGDVAVPMYEEASENSEILMNYFSGITVNVLEVEKGWAHVSAGPEKTGMEGYMRTDELQYGAQAQRTILEQQVYVNSYETMEILAECGGEKRIIGEAESNADIRIIGFKMEQDGVWLQVDNVSWKEEDVLSLGDWPIYDFGTDQGYLYCSNETGCDGRFEKHLRGTYRPTEGELTHEEAYERAIEYVMSGQYDPRGHFKRLPEEFQSEEGLRKMRAEVRLTRDGGDLQWWIMFENPDNIEHNLTVRITPEGKIAGNISRSNG